MTFTEHLAELRTRIIRALFALGFGVILCYVVSDQLIILLASPLAPL
ncbi:MAG TPA: twin-arginine translocase subunit TatC, partial [Candidatus Hydrogenedentes bacterium]|nr:twin-arginine translocase subunit TatC [Candidatus Hydrogenedentota bacterium]